MRFIRSIFGQLLEPLDRRGFGAIVGRHRADAYCKSFSSLQHLLVLIFAQFSGAETLRGLATEWNAHSQHHYHLGAGRLARSTLADANQRRPAAVFADSFAELACQLDRHTRRDGRDLVRLIDSTPIPLGKLCAWAACNGRITGLKMHLVYDPASRRPQVLDITDATVNDAPVGRTVSLEAGATYVFDKGYCHYGWWRQLDAAGAFFVTRAKCRMRLEVIKQRPLADTNGDGFTITDDAEIRLISKGDSKLPIPLRRVSVRREDGRVIALLSNDLARPAVAIATLYKTRWQIELLFRWLKQHLRIRRFLGNNANAIRLQLYAAMIAYVLVRLAASAQRSRLHILRFTELLARCLFDRRSLAAIERPPPVNPSRRQPDPPGQLRLSCA